NLITGTILPGHYFLIQEAGGTTNGVPLPTPDATGSIAMAATSGKVALVSGAASLPAATCPGDDLASPFNPIVGGSADCVRYAYLVERNSGTTNATFTVTLSPPAPGADVTFDIATQDKTANTANNDYVAKSLTNQIIPADQTSYTFTVIVNGDNTVEPDETFFVNVTNVTAAAVTDGQGVGTIQNDDLPALSVNDISLLEGDAGTKTFTFTISL